MTQPHILDLDHPAWQSWTRDKDLPGYRSDQIFSWLHNKCILDPGRMSDLPPQLRNTLSDEFQTNPPILLDISQDESDQTAKLLLQIRPGRNVEIVWLPYENRQSLCISVQFGCSLDCSFCATGKLQFQGNLSAGEILSQVYFARNFMNKPVTNVVYMGMGEPFYNYENVIRSASILHDPRGLNLGARRITISTSGVLPKIEQFISEEQPFQLALSLHSAIAGTRLELMDIEDRYPLSEIDRALSRYAGRLREGQLTFEYIMIRDRNMDARHIEALVRLARKHNAKVNLIPLNTEFGGMQRPSDEEIQSFASGITERGVMAFNRKSPGRNINGACGMLAGTRKG